METDRMLIWMYHNYWGKSYKLCFY